MSSAIWQLDTPSHAARLQAGRCRASIALLRPQRGLANWSLDTAPLDELIGLLGIQVPTENPAASDDLPLTTEQLAIEPYVRGEDLVAAYFTSAEHLRRVEVYWRSSLAPDEHAVAASTLQVSVQTELLDSPPFVLTRTELRQPQLIQQLVDAQSGEFSTVGLATADQADLCDERNPCCLVVRFEHSDYSYVEMVHPLDRCATRLHPAAATGSLRIEHRLFSGHLEKGVILRARVRGLVVERDADLHSAAAAYRRFAQEKLPLTT